MVLDLVQPTDKATYKLINEILNALNNKLMVSGIFFNLAKAFDCLNHDILIPKLQFCGVRSTSNCWFTSYLKNSYMTVQIMDENSNQQQYSSWVNITDGVGLGTFTVSCMH